MIYNVKTNPAFKNVYWNFTEKEAPPGPPWAWIAFNILQLFTFCFGTTENTFR